MAGIPALEQNYPYLLNGKQPKLGALTVQPRITPVEKPAGGEEVGQPRRVVDVDGTQVQYTDGRGYTGLTAQVASPLAGGQAGYKEKPDFIPRELCVA